VPFIGRLHADIVHITNSFPSLQHDKLAYRPFIPTKTPLKDVRRRSAARPVCPPDKIFKITIM
jgi:hypothetical protein